MTIKAGLETSDMEKSFDPKQVEAHWYERWEADGWFAPSGVGPAYCIALPPPNVTGRLHMGHAFQDTVMDVLTRYHRMQGDQTLWQCGTDHAGIATQMVVERKLLEEGKTRHDLGREAFVESVWDWKEHSGNLITQQMRRLGTTVDWATERFTMDEGLSAAVRKVFIELHAEGLIYRGKRLVNWDPVLHTALSDLEVVSEEENGHLWHLRYPRSDGKGHVIVATTRPETMLGDSAVAVHPDDERYTDLVGKTVELPLTGRTIPVIADNYVDPEFGTGCVKITPAHDFNDYDMGRRHNLDVINVLTSDATINDQAPEAYRGLDRFEARKRIVADFQAADLLEKVADHKLMVPRGDRSGAILEPFLTDQWYVDLTRETLDDGRPGGKTQITDPSIEAVESGRIRFVPGNWDKTYYEWMHNIQDWCISRQLWWGHRIPAWYDDNGEIYVGESEQAVRDANDLGDELPLTQDPDVLDTWFSSALWPFSTLGWPEQTDRLDTFYPTSVLVTGFDIIFFWVARMIMMGLKFMGDVPFRDVYIHGLVRDSHGQKMSKSKGNILDPLDLIDGIDLESLVKKRTTGLMQPHMAPAIEKATPEEFADGIAAFGTDAMRFTIASLATHGRDVRFELGRIEGNRNFCNKLWNAARYVLMNTEGQTIRQSAEPGTVDRWILSRLNRTVDDVRSNLDSYRFDLAVQAIYEFTWNEYCDWYLELTKPVLFSGDESTQAATRHTLLTVLEQLLRLMHPIMPFITEEIWQRVAPLLDIDGASVGTQVYPLVDTRQQDAGAESDVDWIKSVLLGIRRIRGEMDIPPGKALDIILEGDDPTDRERESTFGSLLDRLGRIQSRSWADNAEDIPESAVALAGALKVHIPLKGLINKDEEIARLNKELAKRQGDQQRAEAKLGNSRFTDNAPAEVVDKERQKLAAAGHAIDELNKQIEKLARL
jgi:valyl-tRNA synthetase